MTANRANERAQQAAEEIAVDGISLRFNRDEQVERWAAIIAAHFPVESVNQQLLAACYSAQLALSLVPVSQEPCENFLRTLQNSNVIPAMSQIATAIAAAESQPPSMEAANGLRHAVSICDSKNLSLKNAGYRAACEEIKTCLEAALERLQNGEQMQATACVQSVATPSMEALRRALPDMAGKHLELNRELLARHDDAREMRTGDCDAKGQS